jgi:hypothetical protein
MEKGGEGARDKQGDEKYMVQDIIDFEIVDRGNF